jgi:hypothetical protein
METPSGQPRIATAHLYFTTANHRLRLPNDCRLPSPVPPRYVLTNDIIKNTSSSIVARLFVEADTCLQYRCLAMASFIPSTVPAFSLHVKLCWRCFDWFCWLRWLDRFRPHFITDPVKPIKLSKLNFNFSFCWRLGGATKCAVRLRMLSLYSEISRVIAKCSSVEVQQISE